MPTRIGFSGGGVSRKYLIKNGVYLVQPRATTGNITQFDNSVRIYHNGGTNDNITSSLDFSNTAMNLIIEFDLKPMNGPVAWNRLYVDNSQFIDLATVVAVGLVSGTSNGIIKLTSASGGATYARCDMRIKNVYIKD